MCVALCLSLKLAYLDTGLCLWAPVRYQDALSSYLQEALWRHDEALAGHRSGSDH